RTGDALDFGGRDRRGARGGGGGLLIGLALAWSDGHVEHRAGQPALHGGGDLGRGDGGVAGQLLPVVVGIAGVELALGQDVGLAVDLLQGLDAAGDVAGGDAGDLFLGRAAGDEVGDDGVET